MKQKKISSVPWLLNPHKQTILIILTAAITCLLFGAAFFVTDERVVTHPSVTIEAPVIKPHAVTETTYLGLSTESVTSLLNLITGETSELLPADYQLISWSYYDSFPTYLIAEKKDNAIYSFQVSSKLLTPIMLGDNPLQLKKDEEISVMNSITEADKFIIMVSKVNLAETSEFDESHQILSTKTYAFDATSNILSQIPNTNFSRFSCFEYDSLNQRFFTWPCGEGIGTALPLTISDMSGKKIKTIIDASDLGLQETQSQEIDMNGRIEYHNGLFYAYDLPLTKILLLDPRSASTSHTVYTIPATLEPRPANDYIYSLQLDASTQTLIIGGDKFIQLIRFNDQRQATESRFIREKNPFYANFTFPDQGKLYYNTFDRAVRMIDLPTMTLEKSIPLMTTSTEITLFK